MSGRIRTTRNVRAQAAGAITQEINKKYMRELYESLYHIDTQRISDIQLVDQHLDEALKCIENVRTFVGSPENILGSQLTKHGEIAEQVDVWFQNAWNIMDGKVATATFDGVGRTAPEDYLVNGVKVQSKYINGSSKSLSHVLEHGSYWPLLGREPKDVKIVNIDKSSCIGWDDVNKSNGVAFVEPKLMDGAGNLLGLSLSQRTLGASIIGAPGELGVESRVMNIVEQALKKT